MHRIIGNSYGLDGSGNRIYRAEDPGGAFDATQGTYDAQNALQEEICNIITGFGGTVNDASGAAEPLSSMNQAYTQIKAYADAGDANGESAYDGMVNLVFRVDGTNITNVLIDTLGATNKQGFKIARNAGTHSSLDIYRGRAVLFDGYDAYLYQQSNNPLTRSDSDLLSAASLGSTYAADTWYHVFLCINKTTLANGVFVDTSETAGNISGYDVFRRIGSFLSDSSGTPDIVNFSQQGNTFLWLEPRISLSSEIITPASTETHVLDVPTGIVVQALTWVTVTSTVGAWTFNYWDGAVGSGITNKPYASGILNEKEHFPVNFFTNPGAQSYFENSGANNILVDCTTKGWIDPLGEIIFDQ